MTTGLFGSMHRKLVFAVLLLFSFGLIVSMMLNIHVTQQVLNRETTKRAESVLRSMQQKCQYAVTVIDPETGETYVDRRSVDDIVRHIERDEPDVVQVMIVDRSGRVLSSMDPGLRDQRPPDLPFAPGCCRDAAPILAHNRDADTLEVMGPVVVNDYAWGTAFIAFALEPVRREIWRLSLQSLGVGALFMLLGILLSIPLVRALVRPIKQLSAHAVAIGEGDLEQEVEVGSRDEIGQLALSFRTMVSRLKQTLADLDRRMQELRLSEARLQRSEKKYRDIVEHAFEGIFQIEPDGTPVSVNPAMAGLLGYASPDACRAAVPDLTAQLVDAGDRLAFRQALARQGRVTGFETRLHNRDGGVVDCVVSARVVPGDDGTVALIEGSVFDVTERIERERAERETASAKASSEAKSAFLATMSHELRTPMNAIIGFADLALRTDLEPRQADYLRRIHTAAEALLRIINDILDFSKMEAGRLTLETIDFDLEQVLERSLAAIQLQAEEKGLEVVVDLDPGMPMQLRGDPLRLEQILVNLLCNAVKFTAHGEVLLRVRVLTLDAAGVTLEASISDTGLGMTPEQTARVFELFNQADSSTTRRFGGTGLGLPICKNLVALMQGAIEIRSQIGVGSVFHFHVRLGRSREGLTTPSSAAMTEASPLVVVVHPNPATGALLGRSLASAGYRVQVHPTVEPIIAAAGTSVPSAILIDEPATAHDAVDPVDPVEQVALIKAQPALRTVPCLLMCGGRARDRRAHPGRAEHFDGCITKPILPQALRAQLAATLNGDAVLGTPGATHAVPVASATPRRPLAEAADAQAHDAPAELDLATIAPLMQTLQRDMDRDIRAAMRSLVALDEVLCQTPWYDGFREVKTAMDGFDIDAARDRLARLANRLGVALS